MKRGNLFKRLLCLVMVVAMLAGFAVPASAADNATVTFEQVDNSAVSATIPGREPVELPETVDPYDDDDVVRVSIVLEKASTIDAGYSAVDIADNSAAMRYRGRLEKDQSNLVAKIEKTTKEELDVVWNLTLAANLISANVKYSQIEEIENMAGVKCVVIETQYLPDVVDTSESADPNMATSGAQIGSNVAWAGGYTGAGSRIAIIDTGTDTDHQSLNAAAFEYSLAYNAGKAGMTVEEYTASLDLLDTDEIAGVLEELNAYKRMVENGQELTASDLYINSKLAYGFNYIDEDLDVTHDNDSQGSHGSHVAGIATANAYVPSGDGFANALETTFVQGVAPDAQLLTMKVFGKNGGAYDSDYMAAIEDAIVLGCDAVNLSLGSGNPGMSTAGGTTEQPELYQDIMESLEGSGVVVAMSAGNSSYWSANSENGMAYLYLDDVSMQTDGSPGSFTNSFTVASVDNDGFTAAYFSVGGNIVSYSETTGYNNESMTTIGGTNEYVFVNALGTPEDFAAVGEDVLAGKVVMCYRGTISFYEKANAAAAAGAKGIIIVNNQAGVINMDLTGYEYSAPCVSITQADGELFKENGTENTTESGLTYWTGSMEISEGLATGQYNSEYYTMSSFSSWGVPGSLELKPEITAPGGSIYSINGVATDGTSYEVMSGTSMASPQVAGMAAVMAQYVRENELSEKTGLDERTLIQSLLMSTAEPLLDATSGGNYYPVIQQGAGLANVGSATTADSYIMMGANATDSYADGKVKAELGDDPDRDGVYSFSFTINNLTDVEKTFALSADVFTQDAFAYYGMLWMDTWTANLAASVSWTVNGKSVASGEDLAGMDFNGDGVVNSDDGQTLLDYATGVCSELSNADLADLNGDGNVNSYDSYLFFTKLSTSGAVVPANGSANVTVTIALSEDEKAYLDTYYTSGAYIEAYIFAESLTTAEGVEGTVHSIPMLAFYGNWTDASMFDKGSYVEFAYGLETRPPYLYSSNYAQGSYNGLTITYGDSNDEYYFGGNPMVYDDAYYPERNAINANDGSSLASLGFTSIRNAAQSLFFVNDAATGETLMSQNLGNVSSAYYYTNGGYWNRTYYTVSLGLSLAGIPENTTVDVGLTLIPEYYIDDEGNYDVTALGDGATFSMPVTVDNTAPVLDEIALNLVDNTLDITVSDNQYVAAVALFDIYGQYLYTYDGAKADIEAGSSVEYALDMTDVNGRKFLLQVYDYAMNTTTFEITTQIGEVTDVLEGIVMDQSSVTIMKGNSVALSAVVYPVNAVERGVIWTSSDESVVTVDENGKVTAVAVGNAVVTATAVADENLSASCHFTVMEVNSTLYGLLQDEDGTPMLFSWDVANESTWTAGNVVEPYIENAAYDAYRGALFVQSSSNEKMYQLDPVTGETVAVSDSAAAFGAPAYDLATSTLFGGSDLTYTFGVYGTYFLGPVANLNNTYSSGWNLSSYLSYYTGASKFVAICDYGYDYNSSTNAYCDVYLALDNAGYLWTLYFYGSTLGLGYIPTDLNLAYPQYQGSQYCSLISDNNGDLYLSYFTGSTNEIYYLTYDSSFRGFRSLKVSNVGADVWPAALFLAETNEETSEEELQAAVQSLKADGFLNTMDAGEAEEIQLVSEEAETGSLNSVANYQAPVRPMSATDVGTAEDTVVVTVTAKDAEDAVYYNGVSSVDYDADSLVLKSITVEGDYISVNDVDGTVTFGYVDLDGIAAGDTLATLVFEVKNTDADSVTVTHSEVNDDDTGYGELVEIEYPHLNTEVTDAKDATCTEAGYTGDTYCTDCGALLAKGEVIPAAGHSHEAVVTAPTCTEGGYTTYTCSVCGDSYVADATEAAGHSYESKVTKPTATEGGYTTHTCTVCGDSYVDSYTDPNPNGSANTGDAFSTVWVLLMMVSMAGAVMLVLNRKKFQVK